MLRKAEKKIARAQRRVSRKLKGSNNRGKAKLKAARVHTKVRRQRADFTHQEFPPEMTKDPLARAWQVRGVFVFGVR